MSITFLRTQLLLGSFYIGTDSENHRIGVVNMKMHIKMVIFDGVIDN